MTGSAGLLEALPRQKTAHAALLADILDILHGSSPAAQEPSWSPPAEELSPGELRVLRYLPTNLSRPEIAGELSVSPNTVNAHIRSIYAKLGVGDRFFLGDYIAVESTNSKAQMLYTGNGPKAMDVLSIQAAI
jgi:LuxR family transcriptional regulator, maltose regulon positive regulatory protein